MGDAIGSIIGAVQRSSEGMERGGKILAGQDGPQASGSAGQVTHQDYEQMMSKYFPAKNGMTPTTANTGLSQGIKINYKPMSLEP